MSTTMIWVLAVQAVLIMIPIAGIPMWLSRHDPALKHHAAPVSPPGPEPAAPAMAGAAAGMPRVGGSEGEA